MSDFWRGYANVNDDVRHTYERVFYGRELTGNLGPAEVPGMVPSGAQPGPTDPAGAEAPAPSVQPDHAAFYGSVWGNGDAPPVGVSPSSPGPEPTPGGAAAQVQAPSIEPPTPAASSPGHDLTPGY